MKITPTTKPRVRGRLYSSVNDLWYKFEMTTEGVRVRQKHHRRWILVHFKELVNLAKRQPELFV